MLCKPLRSGGGTQKIGSSRGDPAAATEAQPRGSRSKPRVCKCFSIAQNLQPGRDPMDITGEFTLVRAGAVSSVPRRAAMLAASAAQPDAPPDITGLILATGVGLAFIPYATASDADLAKYLGRCRARSAGRRAVNQNLLPHRDAAERDRGKVSLRRSLF